MSVIELALAMGVASIVAMGTARAASQGADRAVVVTAQGATLNAYRAAQSAARSLGRPVRLLVSADSIVIESVGTADTIRLRQAPGPAHSGVALTPSSHQVWFGVSGMAQGVANVTHQFSKGAIVRTLIVSRLGRIRAG